MKVFPRASATGLSLPHIRTLIAFTHLLSSSSCERSHIDPARPEEVQGGLHPHTGGMSD